MIIINKGIGVLAAALVLCAAAPAIAEVPAPVAQVVDQEAANYKVSADKVAIVPLIPDAEAGSVAGYQAWVAIPSGGNLVIDLDNAGHEVQRYTRDGGQLPGVARF